MTWNGLSPSVRLDVGPPPPRKMTVVGDSLCQLVTDWQARRFPASGVALVEQKHDGIRALWIKRELVSRNGVPLDAMKHVEADLRRLESAFGLGLMFFDSEWIEPGGFDATKRAFETKGRSRSDMMPRGVLMIYDAMPMAAWLGDADCQPLEARKEALRLALAAAPSPHLRYVAHAVVKTAAEAERIGAQACVAGHEGIVIKCARSIYERQRSAAWQRIKRKLTVDCEIVEVEPVDSPAGTMATLIVRHEGRLVRISNGLSPDDRRELWTFWPRLIGRVIEVEAMEFTAAGSLRQPRFARWKDRA